MAILSSSVKPGTSAWRTSGPQKSTWSKPTLDPYPRACMSNSVPQNADKKVRVAVVGLGFMGVTHLRAYQQLPDAQIVAVCDAVRLPVNGILQGVAGNIQKSDDINLGAQVRVSRKLEDVLADAE